MFAAEKKRMGSGSEDLSGGGVNHLHDGSGSARRELQIAQVHQVDVFFQVGVLLGGVGLQAEAGCPEGIGPKTSARPKGGGPVVAGSEKSDGALLQGSRGFQKAGPVGIEGSLNHDVPPVRDGYDWGRRRRRGGSRGCRFQ